MSFRSPLARARGLGAAHGGTHHWWAERLTSLALAPLVVWFAFSLAALTGADHAAVVGWFRSPVNAVLTLLLIAALFHHMQLGLQVVIEDYVQSRAARFFGIVAVKIVSALLGVAAAFAVLKVALGG